MKKVILLAVLLLLVMATVAPVASAAPPASGGYWYRVQWGDTLYGISRRTGVGVQTLIAVNGISYPYWVYAGQYLWIPAVSPPPSPGVRYHTVQWGETLLGIARMYGVDAWSIARANGIFNMNWIYAGQVLVIP